MTAKPAEHPSKDEPRGTDGAAQPIPPLKWSDGADKQAQAFVDGWARQLKVAAEETAVSKESEEVSTQHVISASVGILVKKGLDRDAGGDVLMAVGSLFVGLCAGFLTTVGLSSDLRATIPVWFYGLSISLLAVAFGSLCVGVTLKLR